MTLSPAVKELLSLHEIFRKLGFLSADLYIDLFRGPPTHLQFSLRHGGSTAKPAFVIDVWEDCSEFSVEKWTEAVNWWNSAPQAELQEVYENSKARQEVTHLLMALSAKGLISNPNDVAERV